MSTAMRQAVSHWRAAWRLARSRRALGRLLGSVDVRALADFGISHAQVQFEASRPFWDRDAPEDEPPPPSRRDTWRRPDPPAAAPPRCRARLPELVE